MTTAFPTPTWMIGCGNMGGAMVAGWQAAGLDLSGLTVIRPSGTPVEGVRTVASASDAGPAPVLVILAMKPQQLGEVADWLGAQLHPATVMVSILAGSSLADLRKLFPDVRAIVRAMPNLPVAVRRGVIGLVSDDADQNLRREISSFIAPLGYAPWLPDEEKFGVLGAIAGSGPAYVARFTEALAKAAVENGLGEPLAKTLAQETLLGTGWLAAAQGLGMDELARRVASPKGTTEAGLAVLDRDHVLDDLVSVTIGAAKRRGAELAKEVAPLEAKEQPA